MFPAYPIRMPTRKAVSSAEYRSMGIGPRTVTPSGGGPSGSLPSIQGPRRYSLISRIIPTASMPQEVAAARYAFSIDGARPMKRQFHPSPCVRCRRSACRCPDGITLYAGDSLEILPHLVPGSIDALIADPPYSSGGFTRGDRIVCPSSKYTQGGSGKIRPEFAGDNRDGHGWAWWSTLWLSRCLRLLRPGGYGLVFADWRMLPSLTDAFQAAGFVWRGLIGWDKTEAARAPHCGYFRHQCEYIVWGTRGPCATKAGGPWPGCHRISVRPSDKHHMTGKPTQLMEKLVQCVPPGGLVLDPFAGSGTTGVACRASDRRAILIEQEPAYVRIAADRLGGGPLDHQRTKTRRAVSALSRAPSRLGG